MFGLRGRGGLCGLRGGGCRLWMGRGCLLFLLVGGLEWPFLVVFVGISDLEDLGVCYQAILLCAEISSLGAVVYKLMQGGFGL